MPCTIRDFIYTLSSGTIAGIIGSTKYEDIDRVFGKVMDAIYDRGIADSYNWTREFVWNLFKEASK